ncbi:MAG: enoyl-CoA hydratase-related protein [Planctomycetota bacterium]|nr:enoyl-CoA hydratase-related protein [Planctomycetota bacterium]
MENGGKPVIAAVNGYALGGGTELALACHIRIASTNARFGQPEVKLGVIPGYGGTQRLPRLIGKGLSLEIILSGEMVDAQRAERIGLVNRVVEPEKLMEEAFAMAKKIMAQAPLAIKCALESVNKGIDMPLADGLKVEAEMFAKVCGSEDKREGTSAFLGKRPPQFKGK